LSNVCVPDAQALAHDAQARGCISEAAESPGDMRGHLADLEAR
jgi:hypothetical protein